MERSTGLSLLKLILRQNPKNFGNKRKEENYDKPYLLKNL